MNTNTTRNMTQLDSTVLKVAGEIQANAPQQGMSVLRGISNYIRSMQHDTNHKDELFRQRSADEIIESGFYTGCTDRALAFLAIAKAAGIPALYVETMKEDTLGKPGAGMQGHVFTNIYDAQEQSWRIYEPIEGFKDSYDLAGNRYVGVGAGADFSQLHLINKDGQMAPQPMVVDSVDKLVAVAKQYQPLTIGEWENRIDERSDFSAMR